MGVKTLFAISLLMAIILLENQTSTRSGLVSAFQVCQEKESVCQPTSECETIFNNLAYIPDPPFCDEYNTKVCCPLPIEEPPVDLTNPWTRQCQKYQTHKQATAYIAGGQNVKKGELPFMARLGEVLEDGTIKWKCGGTLIAPNWVLTASHCLGEDDKISFVRLGQVDFSSGTGDSSSAQDFGVVKILNSAYDTERGDIGLIRLNKSATFNGNVLPACLPVDNTDEYNNFTAAGWGLTSENQTTSSKLLQVKLYQDHKCLQFADEELTNSICAISETGGTCQGDSGGPILIEHPSIPGMHLVVGVTSRGLVCGTSIDGINTPSIFTKAYSFLKWISFHVEIDSWA